MVSVFGVGMGTKVVGGGWGGLRGRERDGGGCGGVGDGGGGEGGKWEKVGQGGMVIDVVNS